MADPKYLLVAEGDQFLRELYVEILVSAGFRVDQAPDGELCYNLMKKGGFDLVLLDTKLPKLDSVSILKKLSQETPPETPNKIIILLSNFSREPEITKSIELGAKDYLIKSDLTPEQILNEVKRHLFASS